MTHPSGRGEQDPLVDYDPGPVPAWQGQDEPVPADVEPARQGPARANATELDAERSVLAAILTTPRVFDELCDRVRPGDFGAPVHEAIYAAIVACDAAGRPFDPITVADEMGREGTLGQRGAYLGELLDVSVSLDSLDAHVEIVLDRSLRRRMVTAARTIGGAALNPLNEASVALDLAEQQVFELGKNRKASSLLPMAQVLAKTEAAMARARTAKIVGHATGIDRLDEITGGLRGGQFVIIAGRPAMGKSVLALQIGAHIAEVSGLPVPFFSYEMAHDELGIRLIASRTGISMGILSRGRVPTEGGMDRVFAREHARLLQLPLLIDDQPPANVLALRSEVRRLARRGPLGAVVVDYLQLIEGGEGRRSENRTQEVAFISRTLKLLAVELDIPVIAVSQLSRQSEGRPDKRPILSDLRESGSLEQDANLVLAMYRDWVYDRTQDERASELLILKNRQGPLDVIAVDFFGECAVVKNSQRRIERGPVLPPGPAGQGGEPRAVRRDLF